MMRPSIAGAKMKAVATGDARQLARIQLLEDQVAELQTALGMNAAATYPRRLSPQQRAMFGMLLTRGRVSKQQFLLAIYAARPEADRPGDPDNVFKQQMMYLRRRVVPDGIEIETLHGAPGSGADPLFFLPPESRARAMALMVPAVVPS
jgi:hypothetical protein